MNYRSILQAGLLAAAVCPSFARVLINEIHYDPPIKTELTEFIELHNSGTVAVDLSGWSFTEGVTYTFPAGTSIAAGGYLVVAENPGALQAKFGAAAMGPWEGLLANDGESITLRNALGEVEDKVDYQLGFPWPTVGDLPGYSIELVNPNFDNDLGGNWRRSLKGNQSTQTQVLIAEGSSGWKYVKGTAEPSSPSTAWRGLGFSDASWTSGAAPIGYDGAVQMGTALEDMRGSYTSFYMRRTFQVTDPAAIGMLSIFAMYDDGIQVWINGRRVINSGMPDRDVAFDELASGPTRESSAYDEFTVNAPASFLQAGQNVIAIQTHNIFLADSSDAYADVRVVAQLGSPGTGPTPGGRNAVYDTNLPPQLRQVEHSPKQPAAGQAVKITAKITDADGVASARLLYQVVDPGNYIELNDAAYEANWTTVTMQDNGTGGDVLAGDDIYTATLPGNLQTHRRLVRYRIEATDAGNRTIRAPYVDDPEPNFAYFVYNAVPSWTAAIQPGAGEPNGRAQTFSAAEMGRLPTYHLVAKNSSVEDATWNSKYGGDEYLWWGSLVYNGKVYDHVRYRARGGVWRYAMGKNMWKFDFNRGHDFEAVDNYGEAYKAKWRKLNLGANIQQGNFWHRGEQGMFESVGFRLFNMAGVEAPKTHWVNYRIVDDAQEAPAGNQYGGDYWGLYLAIEQEDGRFLDEHDLPDGNLYKMEGGTGELNNQGRYAATDKSDLNAFLSTYRTTTPTIEWWRQNADLEKIYSYHAIVQGIHHYDICYGKNYFYFLDPITGKWAIHTWDLDLTWADNMYDSGCDGRDDLRQRIVSRSPFTTEYKNRIREIRDLLFNTDQAWKVIDEHALLVKGPNAPNILAADRAMWDFNPIMADGSIVDLSKAGQGLFYDFPIESGSNPGRSGSFEAAVLIMKDYVVKRAMILDNLANDVIPATPTLAYAGPANYPVNKIQLTASGIGTASAMKWRVGEIRTAFPGLRGIYEIETAWESPESTTIDPSFTLPADVMRVGRTYRARVKVKEADGSWSHWSAPVEFVASEPDNSAALQQSLRLTEIMYNPPAGSEYEYLEVQNTSRNVTLNLSGVSFTSGVDFSFPEGASLAPGEFALVVRATTNSNFAAFRQRYALGGTGKIFGPYDGSLNNDGERIELRTSRAGAQIFSFTYNDGAGWPKAGDGTGHSLEHQRGTYEYGGNWTSSAVIGGSPLAGFVPGQELVIINEVNAHTDYVNPARPEYDSNDWIELFHRGGTGSAAVNLADYYLSDDAADLKKWRLPSVTLQPGQRISFDEITHFHTPITNGFGLNKAGEAVFLSHLPSSGPMRVADVLRFDGQENGFSVGRFPDGGQIIYTLNPTRDVANIAATPTLVINEVMYNTVDDALGTDLPWQEFVELRNVTASTINLWNTNGGFRISGGISFSLTNVTIGANATIVLVNFLPGNSAEVNRFKQFYNIVSSNVTFAGPFIGTLANSSDRITLEKPEAPDAVGEPLVWVPIDEVIYTDESGADGTTESLNRVAHTRSGNDPSNLAAAAPTPGYAAAVVNGDRDGDGMPNDWELLYGLNPDSAADASLDTDGDGLTNVDEFRTGTDPKNASSRFELGVAREGSAASMYFQAITGKTYSVQYCDDLQIGSWLKLRDVSGVSGAVTVNDPAPLVTGRFYRLVTPAVP